MFTTTGASEGNPPRDKTFEYQAYDEDLFYTPVRKVTFNNTGKTTVFH